MIEEVASALREEAGATGERRLLVLAGEQQACLDAAGAALDAVDIDPRETVLVGQGGLAVPTVAHERAADLLGATLDAVVLDTHDGLGPTTLGRVVGAVRGGGLLLLLCPPLDRWPIQRGDFDARLAVPPFGIEEVTGYFRRRLVATIRAHPGVAIVDVDAGAVERDGLIHPAPRITPPPASIPRGSAFPGAAYEACRTQDQIQALSAFEALAEPGNAVVVEADRGRGKSSVAGLAAGCFATESDDVLVTAPAFRGAGQAFARARELLRALGALEAATERRLDTESGGVVRFAQPTVVAEESPDVLIVDEAAAIAVPLLSSYLDTDRVAFTTTVHGYEGAGRGFSVRFRDRLAASDLAVTEVSLAEPIRYAAGDPVEVWSFRALLLDARPAVDQLVADARPGTVDYVALDPESLIDDEPLLRQAFGLLVQAHYRTEPNDLARLLDAPNVSVRALLHDGHVASVALLAREGGLPKELRAEMYEGGRVRGNMLPDVLTSQLRDESAGVPVGLRVMRIATHPVARSRGLGSHLLDQIGDEHDVDWLGTGYGAMPELVRFWAENGYSTVHLSTTRNPSSGEHSALMLAPRSGVGQRLHDHHAGRFADRIGGVLSDSLSEVEADVVRAALRAADVAVEMELDDAAWRLVAGMAYGPGLFDVDPAPFRAVAVKHLIDPADLGALSSRQERLLVRRVLQGWGWRRTAEALDYHSHSECMRALGEAFQPLVDAYGSEAAFDERDRYG